MRPQKNWIVYLVRCADRSLYCGITNDLDKRLHRHNLGTGAKYTRSRRPVKLLAAATGISRSDALKLEYRIKQSPADRKLSLLQQIKDHTAMGTTQTLGQIHKLLQSVVNNLQELTASVASIADALEKMSAEQSVSPKARRAPVRKKLVVKNGQVETIKRVPATTIIHDLLKKSDQGMDISALVKATGYDQRKVYNVTFRLKKEGKIESVERGIYKVR